MFEKLKQLLGINQTNYKELLANGGIIVDVRSPGEFASGHIKGSVNIPVNKLSGSLHKIKDKNKPVITCCASGMRSASAKSFLQTNGYKNVYNGGTWQSLNRKIQ